jgi:CHAT domain-containing protein
MSRVLPISIAVIAGLCATSPVFALAQLHGAARVLATLWPVGDNSTSEFMWRVYAFREKGHGLPEALRRAQLSVLKGRVGAVRPRLAPYAHPFYWAPYVLMGDWR